jgi:hypothetical protein
MHWHRLNTASTHNTQSNIIAARKEVDHILPTQEACAVQDMFCYAALSNAITGTMYTDLTSTFPIRSFKNVQYIFVAYVYNINAIIVRPMPSRTDESFITAFSEVFAVLCAQDYHPMLNVMDDKCSKAVEKHIRDNKMNIQLVLPYDHHVNAAEWAIATFEEHFVAALAMVNSLYPLQPWDEFLPQVELTLNLLRFSWCNQAVLVNQELYRAFDFNQIPHAPLGTKALVFNDPATRAWWAPHATDGFNIGPANNRYQCLRFYIPATCCF